MVSMIPRRGQGVAGKVPGSLGQLVEGSLQVVEFLQLAPSVPEVAIPLVPLDPLQCIDEQGILAAPPVFGRHSTGPPDRAVEIGSAVAIDEPHVYK
jgi:hypothetical protein